VSAIIIDIDSTGGLIDLVPETAAEVRAARGNGKQIVAIANTMAGSAAYWIAAQADEMVVTPSGQVGSIGVYTIHEDVSKLEERIGIKTTVISAGRFKAEGSPWEPLSRGAQQALQSNVDDLYALFVQDVAAGRGVKTAAVTAGYGEGRMVLAAQALPLKMVDRVETIEQTIIRLGGTADDDQPDDDDDDATQPDDPDGDGDDDSEDAPEARAQSAEGAERLYGEDRREQPAWLL
jgi:signal peptide peptidase SppA